MLHRKVKENGICPLNMPTLLNKQNIHMSLKLIKNEENAKIQKKSHTKAEKLITKHMLQRTITYRHSHSCSQTDSSSVVRGTSEGKLVFQLIKLISIV